MCSSNKFMLTVDVMWEWYLHPLGCPSAGSSPVSKHLYAGIAQMVEQWFCKPQVAGSIPAAGTSYATVLLGEDSAFQADGEGSNPFGRSRIPASRFW